MPDHDDDYDPREFHDPNDSLTDDELTEADAQAWWALEVQAEVALMNQRIRY